MQKRLSNTTPEQPVVLVDQKNNMQIKGSPSKFHYPIGAHDQESLSNFITQMYNTTNQMDS